MVDASPVVLVTGANGLVGTAVCQALVERTTQVRAVVRRAGSAPCVRRSRRARRRVLRRGLRQRGERLPFDDVTYDHNDDLLVVAVGGKDQRYPVVLRHLIHHPRELVVDQSPQVSALEVTDGSETLASLLRPRDGGQGW